jgi:hypothetical protein
MNVSLSRAGWAAAAALAVAFGVAMSAGSRSEGAAQTSVGPPRSAEGASSAVKRGDYLVNAMGCTDCHTPHVMGPDGPEPDNTRFLSGHPADMSLPPPPAPVGPWIASFAATMTAWSGPWGQSYTRNLTPDKETGLGDWTEEQFLQTIRTGRQQGRGRALLPPMPWPVIKNLTDEDLKAMFAYLQTIPTIKNKVPDPIIAEPPGQ